jgi:hypothetical protein
VRESMALFLEVCPSSCFPSGLAPSRLGSSHMSSHIMHSSGHGCWRVQKHNSMLCIYRIFRVVWCKKMAKPQGWTLIGQRLSHTAAGVEVGVAD